MSAAYADHSCSCGGLRVENRSARQTLATSRLCNAQMQALGGLQRLRAWRRRYKRQNAIKCGPNSVHTYTYTMHHHYFCFYLGLLLVGSNDPCVHGCSIGERFLKPPPSNEEHGLWPTLHHDQ